MNRLIVLVSIGLLAGVASRAEEKPRPNLIGISIESLSDVGAPAWGLDEVLTDPEIRARVTPNLTRLAAMGATFANACSVGVDPFGPASTGKTMVDALPKGYSRLAEFNRSPSPGQHRVVAGSWELAGIDSQPLGWQRLIPTERGRDDTSIAGWEGFVESQADQTIAARSAEKIAEETDEVMPRLLVARLQRAREPWTAAGIFYDRFPLDQIALPKDETTLRTLAVRMGFDSDNLPQVAADPESNLAWREAIQAWLASASAADYAVGKIVDAVEAANTDDDPTNDWAIVCFAGSPEWETSDWAVREIGARADLIVVDERVAKPGQTVSTPIDVRNLNPTLVSLGADEPLKAASEDSILALLQPAGERYNTPAITVAGGSCGVRSHRFRFVHTKAGVQELYDLSKDPSGFVDLLDPANEASIEKFGLSPTQLESVRKWLAWKLVTDLKRSNRDKIAASVKEAGVFEPPTDFKPVMPGDFNRDGVVNAADKTLWHDALGEEVDYPGAGADANHDGCVDQEDDEIWRANYGRRAG